MAHMQYKGTGQTHSFRGLLVDDGQDRIRIQGPTGEIAWRITKFEGMTASPGAHTQESIIKIYRERQSSITATVDFADSELLASMVVVGRADTLYTEETNVIFDNVLFSRNIYVTHKDAETGQSCNYYIELEKVKVSAAGMAQLAVAATRRTAPD